MFWWVWILLLNWTVKTNLLDLKYWCTFIYTNHGGLELKVFLFMKITQSSMTFWLKFRSFYKKCSFLNVLVDCVVLGWLKSTKLCRRVKIMWQFALTLLFKDAEVKFVSWYGSIYTCFQNFCTNDKKKSYEKTAFLLNWTDKTNCLDLKYWCTFIYTIYDWFELKNFVFHENCTIKYLFFTQTSNFYQVQVIS